MQHDTVAWWSRVCAETAVQVRVGDAAGAARHSRHGGARTAGHGRHRPARGRQRVQDGRTTGAAQDTRHGAACAGELQLLQLLRCPLTQITLLRIRGGEDKEIYTLSKFPIPEVFRLTIRTLWTDRYNIKQHFKSHLVNIYTQV